MADERELRIDYVDFEEVQRWPRNPKDHDLNEIKNSFVRFGFVSPIIMDEKSGHLVAGHGRIDTLRLMQEREIPPPARVRVEGEKWLVPVLRGVYFNNPAEAEAYVLADNKISEAGGWKTDMLQIILGELRDVDGALDGTGFSEVDIEKILGKDYDYSDLEKELEDSEGNEEVTLSVTIPKYMADRVDAWLLNGERKSAVGRGKGVMRRIRESSSS